MTRIADTRVVKVGGSLLLSRTVGTQLAAWLDVQQPCSTLIVVGGGALADGVRELDRRYSLPRQATHEQAIRAMQVNAFILLQLCPQLDWLGWLSDWEPVTQGTKMASATCRAILDPVPYLLHDTPNRAGERLPRGWHVTSDSIAAQLAQDVRATELVLLKSTLPPLHVQTYQASAEVGFVDQYFPVAAKQLSRVRAVSFRDSSWPEITLVP